jgi:hypothetical protein
MSLPSGLIQNAIAALALVFVVLGGGYSFLVSEYEYRSGRSEVEAMLCEVTGSNSERIKELEHKVDGVILIRAELSGLKNVMSSMDKRLERFEDYFLEARK